VNITVTGEAEGSHSGKVRVIAEDGGQAEIEALAWNDGYVDDYTELTEVEDGEYSSWLEGTIQGISNIAKVDITAKSVEIISQGYDSSAFIGAYAGNEIKLDIDDCYEGELYLTLGTLNNDAEVLIATPGDEDGDILDSGVTADQGDVLVVDQYGGAAGIDVETTNIINADYYNYFYTDLTIQGPILNYSDIVINAGDDVIARAMGIDGSSDVEIETEAWNEITGYYARNIYLTEIGPVQNFSNVDITAGDEVLVTSDFGSWSFIGATAFNNSYVLPEVFPDAKNNVAGVTINAAGDVKVLAMNGEASIGAGAEFATNNTATVEIDSGGDVKVIDIGEYGDSATIEATATRSTNSNLADVTINATATETVVVEEVDEGVFEEYVEVDGGDVKVIAKNGGHAEIKAYAGDTYDMSDDDTDTTSNTANVTIKTTGIEVVESVPVTPSLAIVAAEEPPVYEETTCLVGGDVKVIGVDGGEAEIDAIAKNSGTNTSDILICADGDVGLEAEYAGKVEIEAIAKDGYSNTAGVGIAAGGDDGVEVKATKGGDASIGTKAKQGYTNTAQTIVCTQGSVGVIAERDGDAGILAEATDGYIVSAEVGVGAVGGIEVRAGQEDMPGCEATIAAEAQADEMDDSDIQTTADAKTVAVSREGNVEVLAYNGGEASIKADAHGAYSNTADVGVAAGADLSPIAQEAPMGEKSLVESESPGEFLTGSVVVRALRRGSRAGIVASAGDGFENTADAVVCAPGEVIVENIGSRENPPAARIRSIAENSWSDDDMGNNATTQVYASDIYVSEAARIAAVVGEDNKYVTNWSWGDPMPEWEEGFGDGASLIIDDYSQRKDCPTCPPCPDCGEEEPIIPPAPLYAELGQPIEGYTFGLGGCPALMVWLGSELGIPADEIQIFVAQTFASSTDIQPCDACARLKNAADILGDTGGTYAAALSQVVNQFVAPGAPIAPEQMASIASALANPEAGTQYASAAQWLDSMVQYVGIMTTEMGLSAGDSVAIVSKYVTNLTGSVDTTVAAYVQARLAALGG